MTVDSLQGFRCRLCREPGFSPLGQGDLSAAKWEAELWGHMACVPTHALVGGLGLAFAPEVTSQSLAWPFLVRSDSFC